jgi:predicted phosphodiesterase
MRVAIISDIHGNLVALEAALADLADAAPDQVICLGDIAAIGPQPAEVVARLIDLRCPVVMGNHDAWMLDPQPWEPTGLDPDRILEIDSWCIEQLSPAQIAYLRSFEPTIELPIASGASLLLFHGSPRSNTEIIISTTRDDELDQMLEGNHATALIGGHTHVQMVRRHRGELLINPGSIGMAFQRDGVTGRIRYLPWAEYALVSWEAGCLRVELRRVPFDVEAIKQIALRSTMPHARWWADAWITSS